MAKVVERESRRAIAEQLRREQARKERVRSLAILGACVAVVIALLGSAVFVYLKDQHAKNQAASTPLSELGVSAAVANCSPEQKHKATGNNVHLTVGKKIAYPDAPPASGPHWANFLVGAEIRQFYTKKDRPALERLVHSLEHGHTIVWYDDTVTKESKSYQDLQAIAGKLGAGSYLMAVPWTRSDGASFPSGKHLAITHWTGPADQQGVTRYCGATSGAVVKKFLDTYPASDAPEPGAA